MARPFRGVHRALADPLRIQLFDALSVGERSARELAEWTGQPADRLYYHLRQLEQAGLIEVAGHRDLPGGKVERVYARARVEPPGDDVTPAETAHFLGEVLLAARGDVNQAFAAKERGADRQVAVIRMGARLSRRHLDELRARFEELAAAARDDPDEDGVWTSVLVVLADMQDRDAGGGPP
jgi:DNA-binding transcriptional ArsR family regulator